MRVGRTATFRSLVLALALCAPVTGAAQAVTSTGTSHVTVSLTGRVLLAPTAGLSVSATSLPFDLSGSSRSDAGRGCAIGLTQDMLLPGSALFERSVSPAGTNFRVAGFPAIEIVGGSPVPASQAPLPPAEGAVVCYRSFTLEPFANLDGWSVIASRIDVPDARPINDLYIGSACRGEAARGMTPLGAQDDATLAGNKPIGTCAEMVVVIAIKVDSAAAGSSTAAIRYTLVSDLGGIGTQ